MPAPEKPNHDRIQRLDFVLAAALEAELTPFRKIDIGRYALITTGMGGDNARRCLQTLLGSRSVSGLINVGLAGALSPNLLVGDIVIVDNFLNNSDDKPSMELISAADQVSLQNARIFHGSALSVNKVICKAREKRSLAAGMAFSECVILDMESAAVAETCSAFGTPFMVIRCISDRYQEDLPIDFNNCLGKDGNLSICKVLISVMFNLRALKGMFELKRRCHYCTTNLASFVSRLRLPQR